MSYGGKTNRHHNDLLGYTSPQEGMCHEKRKRVVYLLVFPTAVSKYWINTHYLLFLHFSHNPFMIYSDSITVKESGIGTCGIMMLSRQKVLWHLMHVR